MLVSLLMLIWLNTSFADRAPLPIPSLLRRQLGHSMRSSQQSHQERSYQQQPTAAAHVPEHWLLIHLSCRTVLWLIGSAIGAPPIVVESFGSRIAAVRRLGADPHLRCSAARSSSECTMEVAPSSVATVAIAALPSVSLALLGRGNPGALRLGIPPAPWLLSLLSRVDSNPCLVCREQHTFNWLLMSRALGSRRPQTLAAVARGIGPYLC